MPIQSTTIFAAQNNLREKKGELVAAEAAVVAAKQAVVDAERRLAETQAPGVKFAPSAQAKAEKAKETKSEK